VTLPRSSKKPSLEKDRIRITISADADDYQRFEELARLEDRSIASLIRRAMRELLERQEG
jgi:predicted transcriptional regulator